jgi:DNA/RNA-binding protein KIN17
MEERIKEQKNRKDYWLHEVMKFWAKLIAVSICIRLSLSLQDIVVKVMTSKLGEKYYKKKGIIMKVEDRYQAVVKMIDTNDKIRLDQEHVETVIPTIGKISVLIISRTIELDVLLLQERKC